MPPVLYTTAGQRVEIGRELGSGGEGAVHDVDGATELVAKLYHHPISPDKVEKLKAMCAVASPSLTKLAAWPQSLLLDRPGGKPRGFMMPRVSDRVEIHRLYSPAHRKQDFPNADWAFLLRTAVNCAAVVDTVHQTGCVIGDVNQGNILVGSDATVCLIDCDSFQVRTASRCFRCEVGVAHYIPPELQSINFRDVDRTVQHDCFGLAVLLFQILAMGRHPFAGRYRGAGDMPIERAISERRFAFGTDAASRQMNPPPHALPLDRLGAAASLFERAFCTTAARPSPAEWHQVLSALERSLTACARSPGHRYLRSLSRCPWCELMDGGAPDFFLSASLRGVAVTLDGGRFDLEGCWRAILEVSRPVTGLPPVPPGIARRPAHPVPPQAARARRALGTARAFGWSGGILLLLGLGLPPLLLLGVVSLVIALLAWLGSTKGQALKDERAARSARLDNAKAQLRHLESLRTQLSTEAAATYERFMQTFRNAKDELAGMQRAFERDMRQLEVTSRERQLEQYLDRFFIDKAQIPGIGPGRTAVLESYGIETAADVNMAAVRSIPGFGPAMTQRLLDWRRGLERRFTPDPTRGVADSDRRAIVLRYQQRRATLEQSLAGGAQVLRNISQEYERRVDALAGQLVAAADSVAQAQCDLALV